MRRYVDPYPFDPEEERPLTAEQERLYTASQWRLIWMRFRRHRLAVVSLVVLLALYGSILVTEVLAPYTLDSRHSSHVHAPPQPVHLVHDGTLMPPFVYPLTFELNLETMQREYQVDRSQPQPLRWFCHGEPYRFWNLFEADWHLVCPPTDGTAFLLGTDRLGRDMLSRILHGARISLTIGLLGVAVSFVLGVVLGGLAGYVGGLVDAVIQRTIEIIRSFPVIPLWMALSAALPVNWDPLWVYFGITLILGLVDWPGLARAVRGRILSLREEDFAQAAIFMGARPRRVIGRHLVPSFASHLIASVTLAIPTMILGETALSFLGLGLRPPITSWGVLLTEAQNINAVALYPWLMLPVVPVIVVVLAFNFVGDGLRDAADPYS